MDSASKVTFFLWMVFTNSCWLILCDIFPSAILLLKHLNEMTTAK